MPVRSLIALACLMLVACAGEPSAPAPTAAAPADRPLDGHLADPAATRGAVLLETALIEVGSDDLRRCYEAFQANAEVRFRPPAHGGWLVVVSAIPARSDAFDRRREAAPELHPVPPDGWMDRIVYRGLLRAADASEASVACLSCVFDYEGETVSFRHGYALDTCRRAVPPERELAIVMPPDQSSSRTVSSSPSASP